MLPLGSSLSGHKGWLWPSFSSSLRWCVCLWISSSHRENTHPSKQGHGNVLSSSDGLSSIHSGGEIMSREGGRYGGGKELAESIFFIKAEPGITVLGSCCSSSAWSRHNDTMGGNCVWFVLEKPQTGGKPGERHAGAVGMTGTLKPIPPALQWFHPSCQEDVTSAHMGRTGNHPGLPFQQMASYLRCRGGKLVSKMAIQGQMMLFQYF